MCACEPLVERVDKPHHDVSSIFMEPLFSEDNEVDLACEACYDTPPIFDKREDELHEYSILLVECLLHSGGLLCRSEDDCDLEESLVYDMDRVVFDDSLGVNIISNLSTSPLLDNELDRGFQAPLTQSTLLMHMNTNPDCIKLKLQERSQ